MASRVAFTAQPEMMQVGNERHGEHNDLPRISTVRQSIYDWNGPDDPDNPRNFPMVMRIFSIAVNTILAFVSVFAGAIYAPAQGAVMKEYSVSSVVAILPLSMYNLGMAFGPIVGAPLSETYGRKTVFVATTPIFILFMLGAGLTENIAALTICRFFAGMFASSNINNTSATILDYMPSQHRGVSLGVYYSIPSLGATTAPIVGGFVVRAYGWRWTQWVAVIVAAVCYIPLFFTKETYKKVILRRRALAMGISDGSSRSASMARTIRYVFTVLVLRPLHMLCTEPIVTLISLYNGFLYGLLYTFVISVPWIFRHYYSFDKTGQSLSYIGVTLGTMIACLPFGLIDIYFYQRHRRSWQQTHGQNETLRPEYRLAAAMIGSVLLPISLFAAGWTAEARVHWFAPILFQGMTMMSSLLIYSGVNLFMLDVYGPLYGASASSAMMFSRYLFSAAFPLFALQMYRALGSGWATSTLGFCALAMAPTPWCFWVFGKRIRARSKYETSS